MRIEQKQVRERLTLALPGSHRVPLQRRRALTFKRFRGTISVSNLVVDEELELLHRVVEEGVGRTRERVDQNHFCITFCITLHNIA